MLTSLLSSPLEAIAYLIGIIFALTIHEYAHAWTAVRGGDDTPRLMGRLNLNPASHIDPLGGLMFILVGFGWGKPVLYNPLRLRHRFSELSIALAGPIANLLAALALRLAIIALAALHLSDTSQGLLFLQYLDLVATVNVYLAAFNMLPIPPLDGSNIVAYLWPPFRGLIASQVGLIIILLLIMPLGTGSALGTVMNPLIALFQRITLG